MARPVCRRSWLGNPSGLLESYRATRSHTPRADPRRSASAGRRSTARTPSARLKPGKSPHRRQRVPGVPGYDLDVDGDIRATGTIYGTATGAQQVGGVYAGHFNCYANYGVLVNCGDVHLEQNGATNLFVVRSTVSDSSGAYAHYHDGVLVAKGKLPAGGTYTFDVCAGGSEFSHYHDEVILARPWAGGRTARIDIYFENRACGGIWTSTDPN